MISDLKHYEKHQEDFGIAMTEEFESEVQDMCNLGKALVEQGIEQGIEQKNLDLAKMMLKDKEPIDKIVKYTGFATEKWPDPWDAASWKLNVRIWQICLRFLKKSVQWCRIIK